MKVASTTTAKLATTVGVTSTTTATAEIISTVTTSTTASTSSVCDPNPCLNDGHCVVFPGKYECDCFGTKYTGDNCEIFRDDCKEPEGLTDDEYYGYDQFDPEDCLRYEERDCSIYG